ncbi:MAG TPA: hypothetical protein VMP01_05405 [Pirellulaceae bacterium]|nr:hypothetical protein [Pirellulaceae bacterium]
MVIAFDFVGGPFDGTHLADDKATDATRGRIRSWYRMTNDGQVGQTFWLASLARDDLSEQVEDVGAGAHFYEVIESALSEGEVIVRVKYVGSHPKPIH